MMLSDGVLIIFALYGALNSVAFSMFAYDKRQSKKTRRTRG